MATAEFWEWLCLVPTVLAFFAAPFILYPLIQEPTCVVGRKVDSHLRSKLLVGGALGTVALLELTLAFLDCSAIQPVPLVKLVGAFSFTCVLYVDHVHGASPSSLVSLFLGFEVVSAAGFCLYAVTGTTHFANSIKATLVFVARVYLLILHEKSKWDNLKTSMSLMLDREETYGFWSRCFSISLLQQIDWSSEERPTTVKINRKTPQFIESLRVRKFATAWDKHRTSNFRLHWACASALKQECIFTLISTLCTIPFKLAIPFWVERIVCHAQQHHPTTSTDAATSATSLTLDTSIVLLGYLISRACSRYAMSTLKLGLRTTAAEAVFDKLQKRPGPQVAQHVKLSIISKDIPAVEEAAELFVQSCGFTLEVLASIYYIRGQSTVIAGLLVCHVALLAVLLKSQAFGYVAEASRAYEAADERSDAMATTLLSIKGAMTLGCTPILKQIIQKLRLAETKAYRDSRKAYILPQIMQAVLSLCSMLCIFTDDFFSSRPTASGPSMFKCSLLLVIFVSATRWLLDGMSSFSKVQKSMACLQQLLETTSYELDARYTMAQSKNPAFAIQFNNATLLSEPGGEPLLTNINMSVARNSLSIVTGNEKRRVLLQAAIGNCTISRGLVQISGKSISYCGSDIWLQRKSIKENITGGLRFDETWYLRVIQACCLEDVIDRLPRTSEHIVEISSERLDFSQLQRIALARSVYSGANIIVLDDVFSHQDAATSTTIRHNLFSHDGLLRHGTTVLIATEDWQPFVNMEAQFFNIENGQVSRTNQESLLARLVAETALVTGADAPKQLKRDMFAGSANQLMIRDLISNMRNEEPLANKIETARLTQYLGRDGMLTFCLALIVIVVFLALENIECLLILDWIYSSKPVVASYFQLGLLCAILAGPLLALCNWLFTMSIGQKRGDVIHDTLTKTVFGASYGLFQNDNIEHTMRLLCEGFNQVNYKTQRHLFRITYNSLALLSAVCFTMYPNPIAIPISLLYGALIYAFHTFQYPIWHTLTRLDTQARYMLQKHFIETATGSAHIRAMGWETANATQSQRYIDYYQQTGTRVDSLRRWILVFCDLLRISWMVMFILVGQRYMDPCRLGLALYLVSCMSHTLEDLFNSANAIRNDLAILKEMEDFVATTPQKEKRIKGPLPEQPQITGEVELRDVSVGYGSNREETLSDVNLHVPPGHKLGVHGSGQCGKSALLLALCGVLPYSGSITLDGREIRNIPPSQLAERIIVVPETPVVIPGATVLQMLFPPELLSPGRLDARMHTIEPLIRQLGLEDMISEVGGLNGKFEDLYLTRDQMHLFSFARALVKFTFHRNSVFLIDDIMSKVSLGTYNLMSRLMTALFASTPNTAIMFFENHLFTMLEPSRFARIEGGRVQELDLTNVSDSASDHAPDNSLETIQEHVQENAQEAVQDNDRDHATDNTQGNATENAPEDAPDSGSDNLQ